MKKLIYTFLILLLVALSYSCKDKDEEKTEVPSGWSENSDLKIFGKQSWFLHRSGKDSIKIEISKYSSIPNNLYIEYYKRNDKGGYSYISYGHLAPAYTIEKGSFSQFFGLWKDEDYGIDYTKTNDTTFVVYNLLNMGEFPEGKKFEAVTEKRWTEKNRLAGGWYHTGVVDSTVLAFEGDYLKEYLFVRTSSNLIDSWDYGKYTSTLWENWLGEELLGSKRRLTFTDSDVASCSYAFNADRSKLAIYWESPGKTMIYTRIEN